ncbi:MAG: magnesium/cobalt transporter CorA [Pseudomonadota bacterium]
MWEFFKRSTKTLGMAPGALVHVGEKKIEEPIITLFDFDEERVTERRALHIDECIPLKDTKSISWINIDGIHDTKLIDDIGKGFGLHPLVCEDVLNTHQRSKIDEFEDYVFFALKMISYNEAEDDIDIEQISLILGKRFVLTFQEKPGDVFEGVRERIRKSRGKVRQEGCDYLAYSLLDAMVDSYFLVMEKISDKVEHLEEAVITSPKPKDLNEIHRLKNRMAFLRRSIWPLREIVGSLLKNGSKLIDEKLEPYLRDLYDHTLQVTDAIDMFRDMLSGLQEVYLSSLSNKMNEVMKVLTIFASIFIPLTFVAGVYGMNFEYMPELKWRMGYPLVLLIMLGVALVMLGFFWKKKWFGKHE